MDIRATDAAQLYQTARNQTQPRASDQGLGEGFAHKASDFVKTLNDAEAVARDAMVGRADPQAMVQALAQTELAVEAAVTLRNKVVEAYQEILRMPV